MNYNVSFAEMNRLAMKIKIRQPKLSLEDMRKQALRLESTRTAKIKKQSPSR
ncbi:hypothetical protein QE417_000180 [Mucilaginibacter terrae]|uniref:Uncharacterized protein n=1 Tax=Mucilaginibacter terrae TaxID=1955052 RepID=A0ABU3GMU5_9SPHI|nr:hypothetical protein [Mucilaginibacter terrae]